MIELPNARMKIETYGIQCDLADCVIHNVILCFLSLKHIKHISNTDRFSWNIQLYYIQVLVLEEKNNIY